MWLINFLCVNLASQQIWCGHMFNVGCVMIILHSTARFYFCKCIYENWSNAKKRRTKVVVFSRNLLRIHSHISSETHNKFIWTIWQEYVCASAKRVRSLALYGAFWYCLWRVLLRCCSDIAQKYHTSMNIFRWMPCHFNWTLNAGILRLMLPLNSSDAIKMCWKFNYSIIPCALCIFRNKLSGFRMLRCSLFFSLCVK